MSEVYTRFLLYQRLKSFTFFDLFFSLVECGGCSLLEFLLECLLELARISDLKHPAFLHIAPKITDFSVNSTVIPPLNGAKINT